MQEQHVDIIGLQIAERLHDRLFGVFVGFEIHFGDDKQLLTVNAAFEYPFAHRPFVAVGLRCVNHPITAFDCRGNRLGTGLPSEHKGAEADKRHFDAVI